MSFSPAVGGFDVDVGTHTQELLHLTEKSSPCSHHQRSGAGLAVTVIHWENTTNIHYNHHPPSDEHRDMNELITADVLIQNEIEELNEGVCILLQENVGDAGVHLLEQPGLQRGCILFAL